MTNPALLDPTDRAAFVRALGGIVEHSPWVAEEAFADRPFAGLVELHAAFERALLRAPVDARLAVLRAHPDLAVREHEAAQLTAESAQEQAGAGLDRLSGDDHLALANRLAEYRDRFDFPFIACVRDHGGAGLAELLERRIGRTEDEEFATALREVSSIARHRLADRLAAGPATNSVSTHVLDTARGRPIGGIPVALSRRTGAGWTTVAAETTDEDGRATMAPRGSTLPAGRYRLHFALEHGPPEAHGWYPEVEIVVDLATDSGHSHIPLLLSPFGFTTYRGS